MRARDIMTTQVVTVRTTTPVHDAAALLAEHGFTALPVLDDDDRLIGIVTEADLVRDRFPSDPRALIRDGGGHRAASRATTVGEVMSSPVTAMVPGTDVADLTEALLAAHQRSVPIVEGSTVVGIVSRRDLIRVVAREDADIARDVRHRLEVFGGGGRWLVTCSAGAVTIVDTRDSEDDEHIATVLAEAVPGVVRATVAPSEAADPVGSNQ